MRPNLRDVPSSDSRGGYDKSAGDTAGVHRSILGELGPDGNRIRWCVYDPTRTTLAGKGCRGWSHTTGSAVNDQFVPPC